MSISRVETKEYSSTKEYLLILDEMTTKINTEFYKNRLYQKLGNVNLEKEHKKKVRQSILQRKIAYSTPLVNLKTSYLYTGKLREDMANINLKKDILKVNIPMYFVGSTHDLRTPYTLLEEYFNVLEAPKKELIWFENSSHNPEFQEYEKFAELMRRVQKETLNN